MHQSYVSHRRVVRKARQRNHPTAGCREIMSHLALAKKFCRKTFLSLNWKAKLMCFSIFYTYSSLLHSGWSCTPVPSSRQTMSRHLVVSPSWSDSYMMAHWKLKLSRRSGVFSYKCDPSFMVDDNQLAGTFVSSPGVCRRFRRPQPMVASPALSSATYCLLYALSSSEKLSPLGSQRVPAWEFQWHSGHSTTWLKVEIFLICLKL